MWEFTREEQFIAATTRHQMTTRVKLGARRDGTLTAIQVRVVSNTGAYGGHGGETLAASLGQPAHHVPVPQQEGRRVRGVHEHGPGRAASADTGRRSPPSPSSAPWTTWRGCWVWGPSQIRRKNMIRPGDWMQSIWPETSDIEFGSYGLDQCMDLVEKALASGRGAASQRETSGSRAPAWRWPCWRAGRPPSIGRARRWCFGPTGRYHLAVGSTEMGNGSVTSHRQLAAAVLGSRASRIAIVNADTDLTPYDTGTFASTGTVVAGQAVALTAAALRDNIIGFASRHTGTPAADCRVEDDAVVCKDRRIALTDLHAAGTRAGHHFEAKRKAYLAPRTIASNVHGVRVAVNRMTGEIQILQSVHAADIGRLINPMQCRGQIDGSVAMGFGWALYEKMVYDDKGAMVNPALRNYRIPAYADVPHSEVYFADTYDTIGPLGAKAQGECAINPVAPAVSNAVPTRPASASPTCRCRPSASSPSSPAGHESKRSRACVSLAAVGTGNGARAGSSGGARGSQSRLDVLRVAIVTGQHRRVLRRFTAHQALDGHVVVRVIEECDGQTRPVERFDEGRVGDAVHGRQPPIVGPAHQEVADVDDEVFGWGADVDPFATAGPHLESPRHVFAVEDGEGTVIGVGAGAELSGQRWLVLPRVVVEAHGPDGTRDLVVEESLLEAEGQSRQSHEEDHQPIHRSVVLGGGIPEALRLLGPDVRQEELPATLAGEVSVIGHVDGPHVVELLEIRGRGLIVGQSEGFAGDRVIAARRTVDQMARPLLVGEGKSKKRVGSLAEIPHDDR